MKFVWAVLLSVLTTSAHADEITHMNDAELVEALVDMELNKNKAEPIPEFVPVDVSTTDVSATALSATEIPSAQAASEVSLTGNFLTNENPMPSKADDVLKGGLVVEKGADSDASNYPAIHAKVMRLNYENARINLEKLKDGGVLVDEIPTLVDPLYLNVEESEDAGLYAPHEYVAVVEINGEAKAFPLRVLNWHQGVNTQVGGQPVFVAYDPLSGNVMAMDRRVTGEKPTTFGVTGHVYHNSSIYYDRATKSLWSAFEARAVTGGLSGKRMERYPAFLTTWKFFKKNFKDGLILDAMATSYDRNYRQNPYGNYAVNNEILFEHEQLDPRLNAKDLVLGVRMHKGGRDITVAVPVNEVLNHKDGQIDLVVGESMVPSARMLPITFVSRDTYGRVEARSIDPKIKLETFYGYWFVWSAFNPHTRLLKDF